MCARYIGDQSRYAWKYESGTYANSSGTAQWGGLTQSAEIGEEMNVISSRYVGGSTRNVELNIDGAQDATLTQSTWVQDWRMLGFALGSVVTTGSPYTHSLVEVNNDSSNAFTSGTTAPFMSFTAETAKCFNPTGLNFIKTIGGAMVNTLNVNWAMSEPVSMDINCIGQSVSFSSGAPLAPTANTERPYMWSDTVIHVPSGTALKYVKSATFSINNNLVADHYINGSRVIELPHPGNRDYEVTVTMDSNSEQAKTFYDSYYKAGSEFNMLIVSAKSSVRKASITLSGCKLTTMPDPTSFENAQEMSLTIKPTTCDVIVVDDIAKYGAW